MYIDHLTKGIGSPRYINYDEELSIRVDLNVEKAYMVFILTTGAINDSDAYHHCFSDPPHNLCKHCANHILCKNGKFLAHFEHNKQLVWQTKDILIRYSWMHCAMSNSGEMYFDRGYAGGFHAFIFERNRPLCEQDKLFINPFSI